MKSSVIPHLFAQWQHCITVECGIALTRAFVEERVAVWREASNEECRRFVQLYGPAHRERVRPWFEQALHQLA